MYGGFSAEPVSPGYVAEVLWDQSGLWQYFAHRGPASTLDLLLYSCFPSSVFQFLFWLQTLPYHWFSFSLVSVVMSVSAQLILAKAFTVIFSQWMRSHTPWISVGLFPFMQCCGMTATDLVRMNIPNKIESSRCELWCWTRPSLQQLHFRWQSHINLLHSGFGTERILWVFPPDVDTEQLQHICSSFLLLPPIPCPIFQDVFPYLWILTNARKVRLCSEM